MCLSCYIVILKILRQHQKTYNILQTYTVRNNTSFERHNVFITLNRNKIISHIHWDKTIPCYILFYFEGTIGRHPVLCCVILPPWPTSPALTWCARIAGAASLGTKGRRVGASPLKRPQECCVWDFKVKAHDVSPQNKILSQLFKRVA